VHVILHVLSSNRMGGIASLVLPALPELGLPVRVAFLVEERCGAAGRGGVERAARLGLDVDEIPVRSRVDPGAVRRLAALLAARRPRIGHGHDVKASIYLLAAARLARSGAALVSTHHGIHGRPDLRTRLYERFYTHAALRGFDRVLAVSASDERELIRLLGAGRVRLHRNGADARRVVPDERAGVGREIRRRWPLALEPDTLLVGVVGRLSPEKRHDRALAVAAALAERDPALRWHLACFGAGPLEAELRARAAALGLAGRVSFPGFRAGIGDELAGFDVLLSLSDAEGLPISLIEAGWAATPVLATRVGGVAEVVGDAGRLVAPRDAPAVIAAALHELLASAAERARLGRALQARVGASFSRAAWIAGLLELYRPWLD
jgi:glycosyltransferase involved in cell wall biosynthesis